MELQFIFPLPLKVHYTKFEKIPRGFEENIRNVQLLTQYEGRQLIEVGHLSDMGDLIKAKSEGRQVTAC